MIYLVGVNHSVQIEHKNSNLSVISAFEIFLRETCSRYKIKCITEEMSVEALEKWDATRCVCKAISDELSINHLFCNPEPDEQKSMGVQSEEEVIKELGYGPVLTNSQLGKVDEVLKSQWPLREKF